MVEYRAINPDVEVNGQTILSFVDGLGAVKSFAYSILTKNGLQDVDTTGWYSQQKWLDSFKLIAEKAGPNTLHGIGTKIPENAQWPPGIESIEAAINSIDIAYHMNHRLNNKVMFNPDDGSMIEGIGHYGAKKVAEKEIEVVCENPYPCDFDMGIIKSTAKKFKTADVKFVDVKHKDPDACRKKGAKACIYKITWL